MKAKITIKTIARELGVATSTVSKALRDSSEISEKTKNKIQSYAKLYNYTPNSIALQLKNQKTKVIGVIIPKVVHHFFSTVIKGIEKGARERGYSIAVCFSNDEYEQEVENLNLLSNGRVDGFVISVANETFKKGDFYHLANLIDKDLPMVMFDRVVNSVKCDKVVVDDSAAGYKATNHLIEKGKKRIALITTPEYVNVGNLRQVGYEKALIDNGFYYPENLEFEIDEEEDAKTQIEKAFDHEIDGIFAVNEIYAAIAVRVAHERGLKIPEEIGIVGFTDGLISEYATPSITAVIQHGVTMGEQAVEMLIERLENPEENIPPRTKVISSNLHLRESS